MTDRIVPLTTDDSNVIPLTTSEPELDPRPWREMMGFQRYHSRADAPNTRAFVFDPRWRYSQNPEDYK